MREFRVPVKGFSPSLHSHWGDRGHGAGGERREERGREGVALVGREREGSGPFGSPSEPTMTTCLSAILLDKRWWLWRVHTTKSALGSSGESPRSVVVGVPVKLGGDRRVPPLVVDNPYFLFGYEQQ